MFQQSIAETVSTVSKSACQRSSVSSFSIGAVIILGPYGSGGKDHSVLIMPRRTCEEGCNEEKEGKGRNSKAMSEKNHSNAERLPINTGSMTVNNQERRDSS